MYTTSMQSILRTQFRLLYCPFSNPPQPSILILRCWHFVVMAFAHNLLAVPVESFHIPKCPKASILTPTFSIPSKCYLSVNSFSSALGSRAHYKHSIFAGSAGSGIKAKPQKPEVNVAIDAFTQFKHLLLSIADRNPYLSEGTRQAIATTTALVKKYGADITVVVIDEQQKESLPEHETQLSSIRRHLCEGGFKDYSLLERLGQRSKPTTIIGDVADELNLDLVVISMEAIHTKHVDANLLAEFIPCPVMLLPLLSAFGLRRLMVLGCVYVF